MSNCKEHKLYEIRWSNTTLEREWDITKEIYQTHKNHNIDAKFSWVKGHCNKKENYEVLPLEAHLNFDADLYIHCRLPKREYGKQIPLT